MNKEAQNKIKQLEKEEKYEEASKIFNWYKPSKSIMEAIIRLIDSWRTQKHVCEFKAIKQYYWWDCAGNIQWKDSFHGLINGKVTVSQCSCGKYNTHYTS